MRQVSVAWMIVALVACDAKTCASSNETTDPTKKAERGAFDVKVEKLPHDWPPPIGAVAALHDDHLLLFSGTILERSAKGFEPALPYGDLRRAGLDLKTRTLHELSGTAPDLGFKPAMAFDGTRAVLWLFGGWESGDKPLSTMHRIDVKSERVTEIPRAGDWPPGRNGASAVMDASVGEVLLFGGDSGPSKSLSFTPMNDLWRLDTKTETWARVVAKGTAPKPRWNQAAAFDAEKRTLYMWGGASLGSDDRELHALSSSRVWSTIVVKGEKPPAMQGATMTLDAQHRALVLVGGLRSSKPGPATSAQVWVFELDHGRWSRHDGGEVIRRRDHVAVYDDASKTHVVVGGRVSKKIGDFYESGRPVEHGARIRLVRR